LITNKEFALPKQIKDVSIEVRSICNPKEENVPYIGLEHIEQNSLSLNGVGASNDVTSSKKCFEKGDILLGTLRPYFRKVYYSTFSGLCSTDITVIRTKEINSRFLFYNLADYDFINYCSKISNGTRMPRVAWKSASLYKIKVPPIQTQKKIAGVLAAFDELIEVNRRKIKILEEMAQAVYNEWFVKMRFPGHEKYAPPIGNGDGTAPYRVFDSPLGPIPEGWEVNKIIDFGVVVTGKTPPKNNDEYYGDYMPFIKIPDMHSNIFCVSTVESLSMEGVKYQQKKQLPANSICVSCIGTPGIVCITSTISQTNQQINALILNKMIYREYLYFSLRDLRPIIELYGLNGATMINLNKSKFENLYIKKPADELILAYQKNIVHFFDDIMNLQYKNHALSSLRDLLLPKLISGKIDVSELDIDESRLVTARCTNNHLGAENGQTDS